MAEGFFVSFDSSEIRRAVLVMASHSKGGISEWLEMETDEFACWLEALKELNRKR
ncbi:MAG: hypothetical protein IJ730_03840 [Alphaproteobacteria bacterium]|nr:hypothetical protein [Alphaproteobacteria bacterium]